MMVSETSSATIVSAGELRQCGTQHRHEQRRQRQRHGHGDEEPHVHGHARAGKPGISIRQPPMRQKTRNTSRTVSAPMAVTRWCRAT